MRPEDRKALRDAHRFVPFRICLTDGKLLPSQHPG
jgi:hypothetical protein